MDNISERKDALAVVGLAVAGFLLLVASTTSPDYGLILPQKDRLIWSLARVIPGIGWMSLASILTLFRSNLMWSSAAVAIMVSLIAGTAVAIIGAPIGMNPVSLMSSVSYYAIISGLLCLTIRSPILAGILSPAFLVLQVLTDVIVHLGTGVIQIAC